MKIIYIISIAMLVRWQQFAQSSKLEVGMLIIIDLSNGMDFQVIITRVFL